MIGKTQRGCEGKRWGINKSAAFIHRIARREEDIKCRWSRVVSVDGKIDRTGNSSLIWLHQHCTADWSRQCEQPTFVRKRRTRRDRSKGVLPETEEGRALAPRILTMLSCSTSFCLNAYSCRIGIVLIIGPACDVRLFQLRGLVSLASLARPGTGTQAQVAPTMSWRLEPDTARA